MVRVLLVDDDPGLHHLMASQLKRLDYWVEHVYTGEECVQWLEQRGCDIDLILMDIEMPGRLSGADAAVEIMRFCDIPLIFHSSHVQKDIVHKIEGVASYGYLVKGTDPVVMDATFKMAIRLGKMKAESVRSLRLLRTVFDMIEDPMTVNNISLHSMFMDCNEGFCRITGYRRHEVIGKNTSNFKLWADPEEEMQFNTLMKEKGVVNDFFHHFLTKNNEVREGYLSVRLFFHDGMDYAVIRMREKL